MGCRGAVQKHNVRSVTASSEPIPVVESVKAAVCIGEQFQPVQHDFIVVKNLLSSVIVEMDKSTKSKSTVWSSISLLIQ